MFSINRKDIYIENVNNIYMETFSERLAYKMSQADNGRGISQSELARRSKGVNRASISQWLGDTGHEPSAKSLLKIAEALNCSPTWLQTGRGSSEDTYDGSNSGLGFDTAPLGQATSNFIPTPIYNVELAAGHGAVCEDSPAYNYMDIPSSYYSDAGVMIGDGLIVSVRGNSMEKTFYNKDKVMIDKSSKRLINEGIFAFSIDSDLMIKRFIKNMDGSWTVRSDNKDDPSYEDFKLTPERAQSLSIIGQVVALVHRAIRKL